MKLLNKYPVETRTQVKTASAYFDEYYKHFSAADRSEYAIMLAARCAEIGEPVSEKVAHYAYAVPRSIEPAIRMRSYILGQTADDELAELVKSAMHMSALEKMQMLDDFDRYHNIRDYSRVPDPFDSVFMASKTAASMDEGETWIGPTSDQLSRAKFQAWMMPSSNRGALIRNFEPHIADALTSPEGWQVFQSLPDPHKTIIARMINDNVVPSGAGPGLSPYSVAGDIQREELYEPASARLERLMQGGQPDAKK
jgi:hypothetical protein